jgi:hypothetical protein
VSFVGNECSVGKVVGLVAGFVPTGLLVFVAFDGKLGDE